MGAAPFRSRRQCGPARRISRGLSLLEVLVAMLVVGVTAASLVSMWYFGYNVASDADDVTMAYNLARENLESIKETGFYNTAEAPASSPVIYYYDPTGASQAAGSSSRRYEVTITVVSDKTQSGSSPVQPAADALRTVTITVTRITDSSTLCTLTSYLARNGV